MPDTHKDIKDFLNINYALVDEELEDVIHTNSGNFKISIFLSKKFKFNDDNFKKSNNIFLKYNDTVTNIVLRDSLDSIGLSGYIDVNNASSYLDVFLQRHNNYYLIINITEYDNDNKPKIKYEPYIFDIDKVQNLSSPNKENKKLRIYLVDVMTSILKTHSIASVIKFNREIIQASSYKKIFEIILDYVKKNIQINTNNKYEYKKDLLYGVNTTCSGNALNGNDTEAKMENLVMYSFSKISRDASIYEAMNELLKDCCTSLKTPSGFKEKYTEIGDVLIPFYFKEEYADNYNFYNTLWTENDKANDIKKVEYNEYGGKSSKLKLRPMTMRDIYMPFHIAWGSPKLGVYENINPDSSKIDNTISINGVYQKEILSMQFNPIDINSARKIWKNVIFLDSSNDGNSGNCTLIFFSWFYDYFQHVFLNCDTNQTSNDYRVSNVQPSFHVLSRLEQIKHASADGDTFNNLFDEYNAYTFASQTQDVLMECLRLMGKNLASFILLNDSYTFRISGNLLRRPNEIVKFGFRGSKGELVQELSMQTDINFNDYSFMYIKEVTHQFQGNYYYNDMVGCKICEVIPIEQTKMK